MTHAIPHGGRLAAAQAAYPRAPQPWIDLSTGINPEGWRGRRPGLAELGRLPDPEDTAALEAAAAGAFGVPAECVVAVAGAEAGLRLLPDLLGVQRVAVAAPTYGSHADAWRLAGAEVIETKRERIFAAAAEAVVVVNPNNPDGAISAGDGLIHNAEGRWLVVDESFVETAPYVSVAALAVGRTIVLRSFGKFYGLAGVRLGFVICDPDLAARIRRRIGDWPVSAEAISMGRAAYADAAWAERTRARLRRDAIRLDGLLEANDLAVVGGTDLFRLARCADANQRADRLAQEGILVRTFAHDDGLIRFGLPGRGRWKRLKAALEKTR
jgi:cobalamin biosynthetic protein CobC